ncbi:MAG: ABC transporter ATP-binding protein [Clostridia bacterium]|nr:ABC transporter ATP-binding protein [Clostridia bacterium]
MQKKHVTLLIRKGGCIKLEKTIISLKNITVSFDGETVLENFNLDIHDGEFVTLLGPSGCGKTTTLRIIGGFIEPDSGDVFFNDRCITGLPPYKRQVNTVFQRYALFPHLNVFENVAFGMRIKKAPEAISENKSLGGRVKGIGKKAFTEKEIKNKVDEMLKLVDLEGFAKRRVDSLSGGQQQRVAIARALANDPKILLLDEPLGALDLKLRKEMQVELKKIQQRLGITFIYVTHDQEEALSMSDTIVVMNHGVIQQIGTPTDVYNEPTNGFVADFIGESNIVDGIMRRDCLVEFGGAQFECVDKGFAPDEEIDVVIRPEDVIVVPPRDAKITGMVFSTTFKGVHYEMTVDVPGEEEYWLIQSTVAQKEGDLIGIDVLPENIHIMKKYTGDYAGDEEFEGGEQE